MFFELGWLLLFIVPFGIFGCILLSICAKKNPESTKKIYHDVLIGMTAGGVVAIVSLFEVLTDNWFFLVFEFFVLLCMSLFVIGVIAFIIVYILEGRIR